MKLKRIPLPRLRTVLLGAGAALLLSILLYQRCGLRGCPNVDQLSAYQPGGETVLLDADGKQFAELTPVEHEFVKIESLPDYVPGAFVAVEDKRFYDHNGVDYRRVGGALLADLKSFSFAQGFSTITMQIAGSVWRDRVKRTRKTIGRKIVEVRIAREIERKYSKDEILELYINNIYFGGGAYGIEAASRNYFRKKARDLTLAQAALLAALPKSPTIYNPRSSPERARQRRNLILGMMTEQGKISEAAAARARKSQIAAKRDPPPRRIEAAIAPYFVEAVRRVLEERFGEDLYTAPLRVHTTLDRRAQRAAEEELTRQLRSIENGSFGRYRGERYSSKAEPADQTEYVQGAMVVLDSWHGDVVAHVGGRDFKQSRFDRVTRAKRQAGSAFKPFVYAAALSEGYSPSQHVKDTPLKMELSGGEVWEPKNYTGDFRGEMTLRTALVGSRNVPTIRLAADIGAGRVARVAQRAGIKSTIPTQPSMALGTAAVTPLELARAYTPFATLGQNVQPRWVTRVEDADGRVLWRPDVKRSKVMDGGVAYLVTDMLREAVRHGTGSAVRYTGYSGAAAGKTGTTNDGADVWFVGYTPDLVGAIWMGFDEPKPIVKDAAGGRIAAPVWGRVMRRIYVERQKKTWTRPADVIEGKVDPTSGLLLPEGCKPRKGSADRELFLKDDKPASICPRGKPVHEPNALDHALAWLRNTWHNTGEWIASHFGTEDEERELQERERYLGVPKLPQATDIAKPIEDEPELLGVPLDSVVAPTPSFDPETLWVDTLVLEDTLDEQPDTIPGVPR